MILTGNDIIKIGLKEGPLIGLALSAIESAGIKSKKQAQQKLKSIHTFPHNYVGDEHFGELAKMILSPPVEIVENPLRDEVLPYEIFGKEHIEHGALDQMRTAMKLPVAVAGALMPDAHHGYGLPIGGVLATQDAIIPYAVGVDIGCRMCMTVYDVHPDFSYDTVKTYRNHLMRNTQFGKAVFHKPKDHEVLSSPLFDEIKTVKQLKDKAAAQIGTSGGGNHFVEFGITEIVDADNEWKLKPGKYLAVLSHSGSRGFGAAIANHYSKLARSRCPLPKEAQHLAWLDLNSEEGQEYWLAMNLAGDYASACHHQIHERMAMSLRMQPAAMIENHHNFAWKEKLADGTDVIVHRKGATPAGPDVYGIIPGSMTDPGFIVRGKGHAASINSASHGAGRAMSRSKAKSALRKDDVQRHLKKHGVEVIGSGLDEAPMAYKDIHTVMASQSDLVDVIGTFQPKVVRMCDEKGYFEQD